MHLPPLTTLLTSLLLTTTAASSSSSPSSSTTTITLTIPASPPHLPNPHLLAPSTHATLTKLGGDPGDHYAPLTTTNTFVFRNVTGGSYLADVHSATHGFAPLRVDVYEEGGQGEGEGEGEEGRKGGQVRVWETFRGNEWENKGAEVRRLASASSPTGAFPVRVLGRKVFFADRGSFSIFGILKNPMILMSLVSLGLFIGLPKLMENMDPEMRAEFEKQQQSNPMGSLMSAGQPSAGNFDVAGFLSGHNKDKEGGEPSSGAAPASSSGSGKKGGRR
ncbi:hypothetical protein UCREL1_9799 [Eutypa lata UCREL1]|uniref:ER membrane protein complex subunit 7 beta-sandwich domain-containing protein n=1 Tax=Eutypa lata (strain UCR-EL1) TaxID=1287681 RepID=M7SAR4_EUTLA|nr:hypothetical protein UCREL1_9799 [Eutypa lata UCREL1]